MSAKKFTPAEMALRILGSSTYEGMTWADRIAALVDQKSVLHEAFMRCRGTEDDRYQYQTDIANHDAAIAAWRTRAKDAVIDLAQRGQIVGKGYRSIEHPIPEVIPPHLWHFLSLDFDGRKASGEGVTYAGVHFFILPEDERIAWLESLAKSQLAEATAAPDSVVADSAATAETESAPCDMPLHDPVQAPKVDAGRTATDDAGERRAAAIQSMRGTKREILEHWDGIKSVHGPDADVAQVARYLSGKRDSSAKKPERKTISNGLSELRAAGLIP